MTLKNTLKENFEYASWKEVPLGEFKARWPNFSPQEIACRGDGKVMLNFAALDALQELRTRLGRPLIVNSAYRSPSYNRKVGGAKASQHLKGKAFDISMANQNPSDFERTALMSGFRGIGHYPASNFMHVDVGPVRKWFGTGANAKWFPNAKAPAQKSTIPVIAVGDKPEPVPTPDFNPPARPDYSDLIKETAPVLIPAILGPLTAIANGTGPVQWAVAALILVATVSGGVWWFRRQRNGVGENA